MKKRLLTLQDLISFCEQSNLTSFSSSQNNNEVIVVQTPGKFALTGDSTDGLIPVDLLACHDMTNLNGSHIATEDMETALPSFQLRPILANIVSKDDGSIDFGSHDMEIITNPFDESEEIVNFIEKPVGVVFGESKLVYDEESEVNRVAVNGYLYEDYGNLAYKILESRGGAASVSVELCIREMSYNAKEKLLNITDFYFNGVTLLGEEVKPGMEGSNITLKDFSKENNSLFSNQMMIERLDEIKEILSGFNINPLREGGNNSMKLNELLKKYSMTKDDITFDIEKLSDEELETKFEEVFGDSDEDTDTPEDGESESDEEEVDTEASEEEASKKKRKKCSINEDGNMSIIFEVSHDDIRYALYNLLYSIEENDDEYYYINSVYDTYFVYSTWDESKIFKHSYSVTDDNVSIADERTQLFKEYLTTSEKAALDELRNNYSILESKVKEYEAKETRESKNTVLSDEVYSDLSEDKEFKNLVENIDSYSLDELQIKADLILANHIKAKGSFNYSQKQNGKIGIPDATAADKKKPYGNLFK